MLNQELRSQGVGGSEIAAIVGMDPRRDAFAVYLDKIGAVEHQASNPRMAWGKKLEQVIVEAYAQQTNQTVTWRDETMIHPTRPWQVYTPDALVMQGSRRIGGVDAKNVAWDQAHLWEGGAVPAPIALQLQWYCSGATLPWWDAAALFGGNDLRIYRINQDAEVEAILLEQAEKFWRENVLARVPPPVGPSQATIDALKRMFPKNVEELRPATAEEMPLIEALRVAKVAFKAAETVKDQAESAIKFVIGEAGGLLFGKDKITWRKDVDSKGPDWEAIARAIYAAWLADEGAEEIPALYLFTADHQVVTRIGPRKLLTPRYWTKD